MTEMDFYLLAATLTAVAGMLFLKGAKARRDRTGKRPSPGPAPEDAQRTALALPPRGRL